MVDLAEKIAEEMKSLDAAIQEGLGVEVADEPPAPEEPEASTDDDASSEEPVPREERVARAVNVLVQVTEQLRVSIEEAHLAAVSLKEALQFDGETEPSTSDDEGESDDDEVSQED
jgi:hypothetical protein